MFRPSKSIKLISFDASVMIIITLNAELLVQQSYDSFVSKDTIRIKS